MKDYRLSEIVAHCKEMHDKYGKNACNLCDREVSEFCIKEFENCPSHWDDIEPREELRAPTIGTSPQVGFWIAAAKCSVCGQVLEFVKGRDEEQAKATVNRRCPNYCPHCGARLK